MSKVIITCAVTGAIHTPSMSDHLPITPQQIAEQSIAAAEAGASIIHLHARDPIDGRPTPDPAVFMQFLPVIKQSTDAVINITTGGGLGMSLDERLAAPLLAKPEMCSLNMGSMNFNIAPSEARVKTFKHAWEKPYLEGTTNYIFRNTFQDIEQVVERLGKAHGTRFEFECYDVGHLYNLAHMLDRKIVEPPLFTQTIFGILAGIPAALLIVYNGMILGAFSALHHGKGIVAEYWAWILPHDITELLAITLFGGCGLRLGWTWIHPGWRTRGEALRRAACWPIWTVMVMAVSAKTNLSMSAHARSSSCSTVVTPMAMAS